MPTNIVLAAIAMGASIPLLWWSVSSARPGDGGLLRRVSKRGEATADMRELALAEGAGSRVVMPAMRWLLRRIKRITPAGWIDTVQRRIILAGLEARWPLERVVALQVLLGIGFLGLGVAMSWGAFTPKAMMFTAALGGLGAWGPSMVLDRRARHREQRIQRELPDALDQITMSVEAGLGFEAALRRAAEAGRGPLAEEFYRVLKEMQIGVSRTQALRNLADRSEAADLHNFVIAVAQAEEYGLPIAQVLRVQAAELRMIRRQRAEEQAMKLPVKLIFPLGLCIFPAFFIVLLGPGVIRIWRSLGI